MKRFRRMRKLAMAVVMLVAASLAVPLLPYVSAQITTGSISGTVSDQRGAVIAGADVTAKNTATGVETKGKTNSEGVYNFPRLLPGKYTVTIEAQGFKRQEYQEVAVTLGQTNVLDATLEAGQVTETITVTAQGAEIIQKEQAQVSSTFETRQVAELPSNIAGGGIDTLALLAPGVTPGFGNVNSNGTTLSVNGQRARSNNFTIDGGDNNDLSIGGPNYFVDNQDIVSEFQVITNNFSAEYGRNQGAIVNIVTKAGTNEFHGTASWFHRDRKLFDSLTNIEKRGGTQESPTPFLYNVYGGTLGGPIKQDRAFFFGSYQVITGREIAQAQSGNPTIAPEELGRLAALFPNNPVVQALTQFSAFAINDLGTLTERSDRPTNETVTIGGQAFRVAYPERNFAVPFTQHEFSARGDLRISDEHAVWYRQLYQTVDNKNALGGSSGFVGDIPASSNIGSATLTSQLSSTSVNEFRFIFNRLSVIFGGGCEGLTGCIPHPDDIGSTFPNLTFTGFRSSGAVNVQTIGPATNLPQGRVVTVYQFQDNYSKTIGRHQLKMGADVRRLTNAVPFLPNVNGAFRFPSATAIQQNRPSFVNLAAGEVEIAYNETDQFYYFQDNWRVRDNLTLNLGVRYEYIGQPINTLHELSLARESDPSTALWKQSLPLEARTWPKLPADKTNWAPRVGFVYSPRFGDGAVARTLFGDQDSTVISGGYSVAYDPPFYNIMLNISTSSPLVFLNTTVNPAAGPVTFPLPSTFTGEAVQNFAASAGIIQFNRFDPAFFNQTQVSSNFYNPYIQQWSFRVQREISRNNVFEARYVGNHAVGLFQTLNRNPRIDRLINGFTLNVAGLGAVTFPGFPNLVPSGITPQVAGVGRCVDDPATTTLNEANACAGRVFPQALVRSRENTAQSTYHGLQLRYQGRVANQASFGLSYAFSKALDNSSEIFGFAESPVPQNPFDTNAGEKSFSGFDRRHFFSANWVWDVPGFRSQEGVLGRVLGGWQLNGTYFIGSGRRFSPSQFLHVFGLGQSRTYFDPTFDGGFIGFDSSRPFLTNRNAPRNAVGISQVDAALIFGIPAESINGFWSFNELNKTGNTVAVSPDQVRYIFAGPGAARIFGNPYGNAPRGFEQGKRLNNLNFGIFKNIRITETVRLQFRTEMFNALNHANPGIGFLASGSFPDSFIEDAGADDGFNDLGGAEYSRRAFQFGLKVIF